MATAPFKDASIGGPIYYPDAVVSVPARHLGIAQGRSSQHIMGIKVERGPAIGVAMTAKSPVDYDSFSDRDRLPRVIVAQIDRDPQQSVQSMLAYFGSRATENRRVYLTHDGSNEELYAAVRQALSRSSFKMLRDPKEENNLGMHLDTGEPFRIVPTAPLYQPNEYRQKMIEACIAGQTYMDGPLELLFDFSTNSGDFKRDFALSNPRSFQMPGDALRLAS